MFKILIACLTSVAIALTVAAHSQDPNPGYPGPAATVTATPAEPSFEIADPPMPYPSATPVPAYCLTSAVDCGPLWGSLPTATTFPSAYP